MVVDEKGALPRLFLNFELIRLPNEHFLFHTRHK